MLQSQWIASLSALFAALGATTAAIADITPSTQYVGTINGGIYITMTLRGTYADPVVGSYMYSQYARELSLTGKHTDAGGFTLTESSEDGSATGTFRLTPRKNAEGKFAGTWKSADGKRTLPVLLAPVADTVTLESARSDRFEVTTRYLKFLDKGGVLPEAFCGAVNDHLARQALEYHNASVKQMIADTDQAAKDGFAGPMPWTQEMTPTFFFGGDDLVSIRDAYYVYTGGAHGNPHDAADNYAWVDGKLVPLTNADLVAPANMQKLRALCVQELKTQKASWPDEIKWDKDSRPTINFTGNALVVTFDPYEAGSYAEGFYTVALPWEKVKPLIPGNSPLRELAGR